MFRVRNKSWKVFFYLLYKCYLVQRKHAKFILLQFLIPVILFVFVQRFGVENPSQAAKDAFFKSEHIDDILDRINPNIDLFYFPINNVTSEIMTRFKNCSRVKDNRIHQFETGESGLIKMTKDNPNAVLIQFENSSSKVFKYKLRSKLNKHLKLYKQHDNELDDRSVFIKEAFIQIQHCLDFSFINYIAGDRIPTFDIHLEPFPEPARIKNDHSWDISLALILITAITFFIHVCTEIHFISKEKMIGIHVLLAMNGITITKNLSSWLVSGSFVNVFHVTILVVLSSYKISLSSCSFVNYSDTFIIWLLFFLNSIHTLVFGLHVSSYFSRTIRCQVALMLFYLLTTVLFVYMEHFDDNKIYYQMRPLIGLAFPNVFLLRGLQQVKLFEQKLIGVRWKNMFESADAFDSSSVGMIFLLSSLGILLNLLLSIYIYAVTLAKIGVAKRPIFFFGKVKGGKLDELKYDDTYFEEPPACSPVGIKICSFKKEEVHSLGKELKKGIDINFYKGHVTALLGHSGAGKSVMLSFITGMQTSFEGTVLVNDQNLKTNYEDVVDNIGICPQENIFFLELNVFEQLFIFGMLKNCSKKMSEMVQEVHNLAEKLGLGNKLKSLCETLTVEEKRYLCLGMALIADADVLILDEPTTGMNSKSRQKAWDIIMSIKHEKTILISTHDMEEADIVGDRIAIIHSGILKCYGTSMFLKKIYGGGNIEITLYTQPNCDITTIICYMGPCELIIIDSGKLVLGVPYSQDLLEILDNMEKEKTKLQISGFTLSLITLDKIFLKVVTNVRCNINEENIRQSISNQSLKVEYKKLAGFDLTKQQIQALFYKKYVHTIRRPYILLLMIILPIIGGIVIVPISQSMAQANEKVVSIKMSLYPNSQSYYYMKNNSQTNFDWSQIKTQYHSTIEQQGGTPYFVENPTDFRKEMLQRSKNNPSFSVKTISGVEFDLPKITGFYHKDAPYSLPISVNAIHNSILKIVAGVDYKIETSAQPLPTAYTYSFNKFSISSVDVVAIVRASVFTCFIFLSFAYFVLQPGLENRAQLKHLQLMTGLNAFVYWITHFLFDLAVFLFSMTVCITCIYVADSIIQTEICTFTELWTGSVHLLLFALNAFPISYIASFWKKSVNALFLICNIVPFVLIIGEFLLKAVICLLIDSVWLKETFLYVQMIVFSLIPHWSFFYGCVAFIKAVSINAVKRKRLTECTIDRNYCDCTDDECNLDSYFESSPNHSDYPTLTRCMISLACTCIFYFFLLFFIEYKVFHTLKMKLKKVRAMESDKACNSETFTSIDEENSNSFLVDRLNKAVSNIPVVEDVIFELKRRECFGILGPTGAGKSKILRMISNNFQYLPRIGYCPQRISLLSKLNSKEHLRLFAQLRGVPEKWIEFEINSWIDKFKLWPYNLKESGTFSDVNRRRLNIAISMIGDPDLILLDEPTALMDPSGKRLLWNVIASCQANNQSILMTCQSTDECETMCTRIGILFGKKFVCIGSSQELKEKYNLGFDINLKIRPKRRDEISYLKNELKMRFNYETGVESVGQIGLHIPNTNISWSFMYKTMMELKTAHECIEDFTITSATLEQLVFKFSKMSKN